MTNTRKRIIFFVKVAFLIVYARLKDIYLMPFSFYRTAEEQKKLFDEGKSKCDGKKKISKHQKWLAIDLVIVNLDDKPIWDYIPEYDVLGKFWKTLGGTWGKDFPELEDIYHFEY